MPTSRVLPPALKANGLRNLPAIIHGDIAIDTVEEIIDHIEAKYPDYAQINDPTLNENVDKLTRNFFFQVLFLHQVCFERPLGLDRRAQSLR